VNASTGATGARPDTTQLPGLGSATALLGLRLVADPTPIRPHRVPISIEAALSADDGKLRKQRKRLCNRTQKKAKANWGVFSKQDLRQVADLAIWRALQAYDPIGTATFTTYAHSAIRNALTDYRRQHRRHVKWLDLREPGVLDWSDTSDRSQTLITALIRAANHRNGPDNATMLTLWPAIAEIPSADEVLRKHFGLAYNTSRTGLRRRTAAIQQLRQALHEVDSG